jgi:hypothetical protein
MRTWNLHRHLCTQVAEDGIHLPAVKQDCVPKSADYTGTSGYGFSTTRHCSTTEPGCVCSYNQGNGLYESYNYQTAAVQEPYAAAVLYCNTVSGGTVTCFGGTSVPDAGAGK